MIQRQTILEVMDNSGVQKVLCIGIDRARSVAGIGHRVTAVSKKVRPQHKVSLGEIVKALVVRTTRGWVRPDGMVTNYNVNGVILLKKNPMTGSYLPLGSRIIQPLSKSLKVQGYHRILSLSSKWI